MSYQNGNTIAKISKPEERIISKNGCVNIKQPSSRKETVYFLEFHRLVDSSWTYTILMFLITIISSWFIFAMLYWLICFTHGDFETNNLPEMQKINNHVPCIHQVTGFASCFLFSVETQHTVGYGIKATTDECPEAIFVNAVHCIIGFIMQGFMAVVIFSKMTLPRLRSKTLLFSKYALISRKNNDSYFMFRVGDIRKNHIIDVTCRAFFVFSERTTEGEILTKTQTEIHLHADGCKNNLFFNWPLVMWHKIDKNSPLCKFLNNPNERSFEIVCILEGTVESTGQMTQNRTSYLAEEILWDKTFDNVLNYNQYRKEFEVDFSKFDKFVEDSVEVKPLGLKV